MYIVLNERKLAVERGSSVLDLLASLSCLETPLAVALDGEFLPRGLWAERKLEEGSQVQLVSPMQGG